MLGVHPITFVEREDLVFLRRRSLPFHPNGMRFTAIDAQGQVLGAHVYYSVGGGFVVDEEAAGADRIKVDDTPLPFPFATGDELLGLCRTHGLAISELMLRNETCWRPETAVRDGLLEIWGVMQECVRNGCRNEGILPGGMKIRRRAAALHRQLTAEPDAILTDHFVLMDWVNLYALAVNEENAAGGRVVTAPTNGAAGIVPAVLHYYVNHLSRRDGRWCCTLYAHGGGDRDFVHAERVYIRRRGGLSRRGRFGMLDGRGWSRGGARRHTGAGGERRRDWHGAQPGSDLRPGWRTRASSVHRAQRDRGGQGHQRRDGWRCAATASTLSHSTR